MSDSLIYDISQQAKRSRLRREIKRIRLKQKDVSELSGIPESYLSAMLTGIRSVTDDKVLQIGDSIPEFNASFVIFGNSSKNDRVAESVSDYQSAEGTNIEANFSRLQAKIEYQDKELSLLQNQMDRLLLMMSRMDEEVRQLRARLDG